MRSDRGFTLLELILAMVAGVTISAVVFTMITPVENWFFTKERVSGMSADVAALTRMIKEIRRVKDPASITTFAADQMSFVDYDDNAVTFQKSGTDVLLSGNVLIRNVQNLTFTYLMEDGSVASSANDIRVIRVRLDITSGDETIRLRSAERIRNVP